MRHQLHMLFVDPGDDTLVNPEEIRQPNIARSVFVPAEQGERASYLSRLSDQVEDTDCSSS
ncbi:MAG: hypothetical protein AAGB34_06820 [Planctomycetota bacterium]